MRPVRALVLLTVVLLGLTGCATVPGQSDVTVLRRIGGDAEPSAPPGPVRGAGPLETVRGWVLASGATTERHEAARAFLTPQAAGRWDDGATPTVVADQVDTVFDVQPGGPGQSSVRVRATRLGVMTPAGSFLARPGEVDLVVQLTEANGQWRISGLPPGTIVRRSDLTASTRPVRTWFLDPTTGDPVADARYLPTSPQQTVPSRALQMLLAGPSSSVAGAVVSALPPGAALHSAVTTTSEGSTLVDLAQVGALDDRRISQITRQVVLTLAGVGVPRVRLLADGEPLVPGKPDITVEELLAGLPPAVLERRDVPVGNGSLAPTGSGAPGLLTVDGRVRTLDGTTQGGPAGSGEYDARSAAVSPDGQYVGVVAPAAGPPGTPGPQRLLVGLTRSELTASGIEGGVLTRPTWSPNGQEVWTAVDGTRIERTVLDPRERTSRRVPVDARELTALGPLTALRISPDGVRLAAVVGGRLVVGAVARDGAGGVRVSAVETLRPESLDGVRDVAWARSDRLVAVGGRTGMPVAMVSVDGLSLEAGPTTNLTLPVTSVAAAPGRPLIVVDQSGAWSLPSDGAGGVAGAEVWRSLPAGRAGSVPAYPG